MCGIAGFVGPGSRETLARMAEAIAHRGPDAQGLWHEEATGVHLGHRRLAIVDLAGGAQPMWSEDGAHGVVFNGEIYNHAELRAELQGRGCRFATDHSDTEVLLHAYREWGDAFPERLNGMWAFVLYDRPRGRLFGSRDRFGKKPLAWFHEGGVFAFASELTALRRHPACPSALSELSLQKYFAYGYIPAPRTIYERVWKLAPGHHFSYDLARGELKTWRYWQYRLEPDEKLTALCARPSWENDPLVAEAGERLRDALGRAVERRFMSDVPLGIFLSGGIDSSAVAALATARRGGANLHTFAIGFQERSFDESAHARRVAELLGTRHESETLDLDKSLELLPEIVSRLDEPLGDSSILPTYLLSRFTRRRVTVALGGDGGDELFAGYDPFRALQAAERYARWIPGNVHEAIRHLAARLPVSHANVSFDFKIKRTLRGLSYPPALWNPVWMGAVEPRELAEVFTRPAKVEELYSEAIEAWERPGPGAAAVDRALHFWTELYLAGDILAKVDRASMLCSLEARSPFLDLEVAEVARRLPWQMKLHRGETKWLLKRALAPILPREIIHRRKKGFGIPIGRWLREGRFPLPATAPHPLLRHGAAEKRWGQHLANRADERLFLWNYWLLDRWNASCAS